MKTERNEELRKKMPILNNPKYPWANEPDRADWTYKGLRCYIFRTPNFGILCGYVEIKPPHPLFGKDVDDCDVLGALVTHGGVTHTGHSDNIPNGKDGWWIGFDCAHGFDVVPLHLELFDAMRRQDNPAWRPSEKYRDFEYVKSIVEELAVSLKAFEAEASPSSPQTLP